jgi:hypothetical protein
MARGGVELTMYLVEVTREGAELFEDSNFTNRDPKWPIVLVLVELLALMGI